VRDADDRDRLRDVRGDDRRLPRPEDLLHRRRDLRLPLPLPQRPGLVRHLVLVDPREPLGDRRARPGNRDRDRRAHPPVLAEGQEVVGAGKGRRRDRVEAVIDKDLASALLAIDLGADLLAIVTDVDPAYAGWATPEHEPTR